MRPVLTIIASLAVLTTGISGPANARDISPTILLEAGPSDMPQYRKMVRVKYLSGTHVRAHYKAYNRREFINAKSTAGSAAVTACAKGKATSLKDIRAYEKAEAKRKRQGLAPERRTFCIKNIPDWTAKNKDRYLDPIFASMPYIKGQK